MAENAVAAIAIVYTFIAFLTLAAVSLEAATKYQFQDLKETKIVFYMHDLESGRNVTSKAVGGVPKSRRWILDFGTVHACDDKLIEAYDWNSTQVGRAQGIYMSSALDGSDLHLLISLVLTNKELNGSILEIQGADMVFQKYREVSVVFGTGKFKLARGFATLETVFLDIPNSNAIVGPSNMC
ncbi:hypothetical protein FNV43_RR13346 [Rhamnella rubrinervis]|uniref:Dirigent protein n=1 Tax=Rhamnella rubrinervis TaxID=2594499 RepID=A0A8K0H0V9_9ROSA|nr:hypothetical protein FNV43_RR13346 [Rhamnella rubrinervis]